MPPPTPIDLLKQTPLYEISLKDLAEILIKHFGVHEGIYDVGFKLNIAVGQVGTESGNPAPGAVMSIAGIGLSRSATSGLTTVDASVVNPTIAKTPPKKRTKA